MTIISKLWLMHTKMSASTWCWRASAEGWRASPAPGTPDEGSWEAGKPFGKTPHSYTPPGRGSGILRAHRRKQSTDRRVSAKQHMFCSLLKLPRRWEWSTWDLRRNGKCTNKAQQRCSHHTQFKRSDSLWLVVQYLDELPQSDRKHTNTQGDERGRTKASVDADGLHTLTANMDRVIS